MTHSCCCNHNHSCIPYCLESAWHLIAMPFNSTLRYISYISCFIITFDKLTYYCTPIRLNLREWLSHWGREAMAAFFRMTFSNAFFNGNIWILIKISLSFATKLPIDNSQALVPIMACRWSGDKSLCESMMVRLPTHVCLIRPQWLMTLTTLSERRYINHK